MIGFSLTEPDKNIKKYRSIESSTPHPIEENSLFGDRYVAFLRKHASSCTTAQELQALIVDQFEHMTWNFFDLNMNFVEAGQTFVQDLFERDGIKRITLARNNSGEYPDPRIFSSYREIALILVIPHIWTTSAEFVAHSIDNWRDIWSQLHTVNKKYTRDRASFLASFLDLTLVEDSLEILSQNIHAYQSFFLDDVRWDEDSLALFSFDIPSDFHNSIHKSFAAEIQQLHSRHSLPRFWTTFFEQLESYPEWMNSIFKAQDNHLFWAAIHLARCGEAKLLELLPRTLPTVMIWENALNNQALSESECKQFFSESASASASSENINWVLETLAPKSVSSALTLMDRSPCMTRFKEQCVLPQILEWELLPDMVNSALRHQTNLANETFQLIMLIGKIRFSNKQGFKNVLLPVLSPTLGLLFLGEPGKGSVEVVESKTKEQEEAADTEPSNNTFYGKVNSILKYSYQKYPRISQNWVEDIYKQTDNDLRTAARERVCGLVQDYPEVRSSCVELNIIQAILCGKNSHETNFNEEQLTFWLATPLIKEQEKHIPNLDVLYTYAQNLEESPKFSDKLVAALCAAESEKIAVLITEKKWEKEIGWRLYIQIFQNFKTVWTEFEIEEKNAFLLLPPERRLWCMERGLAIEDSKLGNIENAIPMLSAEAISKILWSSLFCTSEKLHKKLIPVALNILKNDDEEAYNNLKERFGSAPGFFSSMWTKVTQLGDSISRTISQSIPDDLTLERAILEALSSWNPEETPKLFRQQSL